MNCPKLSSLTIPETVTFIDSTAFKNVAPIPFGKAENDADCDREKGEGGSFISKCWISQEPTKPTIYGSPGSYADQFAKENGMIFKKIQ